MKFFLDENFPKAATEILRKYGHEVIDPRGTELEGSSDAALFKIVQNHCAVFLSTDRDFFHTIPHLHPSHCGIIVIALKEPNRERISQRLEWILKNFQLADFSNRVFQFRDSTWLAYPPLDTRP